MRTTNFTIRALVALSITFAALVGSSPGDASAQAPPGAASTEAAEETWRSVSSGMWSSCAIRADGRLFCWGENQFGQLGVGATGPSLDFPMQVRGGRTDWASVTVGLRHACAIRADGRLFCWGDDGSGQLGDGPGESHSTAPREVAGGARNWSAVTAGQFHTCGLRTTGVVWCWGNDAHGQLGDPTGSGTRFVPVRTGGSFRAVEAGSNHTCAIHLDASMSCWGDDTSGQSGNGPYPASGVPYVVNGGLRWAQVSAGDQLTCGRTTTGTIWCWGDDAGGQLGNGDVTTGSQPAPVQVVPGGGFQGISAGLGHTCARHRGGETACWGNDFQGQLGDGQPLAGSASPRVVSSSVAFSALSAGGAHTCARLVDGRLRCWGDNSKGQLGDRTTVPLRAVPGRVGRSQLAT